MATRDQQQWSRAETQRVLIVRIGAMGDVLHAMPAIAALRAAHPEWSIEWVVEPRWLPLLKVQGATTRCAAMPLVDKVHLAATREWKKSPLSSKTLEDMMTLRRELRSGRFDVCVDMQGSIRSAVIGRMAKAKVFAGPADPREGPARWLYGSKVPVSSAHVVEQGCELLGAAVSETLRPGKVKLPVDVQAEEACEARLKELGAETGFVLMAAGAGWGAKQWPAERFGAVAAELDRAGYRVLVSAYSKDDVLANEVVRASGGRATVFPCNMVELIAVTRRMALVIAGDTGPLHLAAALERPVVALFGPTDPKRNGPYGTEAHVLRHGAERRDHRRLEEPEAGLLEITVDEVAGTAFDLLKGRTGTDTGKVVE